MKQLVLLVHCIYMLSMLGPYNRHLLGLLLISNSNKRMFAFTFLFQLQTSPKELLIMHDPSLSQGGQMNSFTFAGNQYLMQNGTAETFICESNVVMIFKEICLVYFILSLMDAIYIVVLIIGIDISTSICYLRR